MEVKDFYLEVAKGNKAGHSLVHKFGGNVNVPNGSWVLVSLSNPSGVFPTSGSTVRIKASGHVQDTASGTGAREITVVGINENLEEINEIIVTSGTNQSLSTTNRFWRLYRAFVSKAGTYGLTNVGNIVIENSEDMLVISEDEGQTQHGAYSIPSGKRGYLLSMAMVVNATKAADFRVFIRENFTNVQVPFAPKKLRLYFNGVLGQIPHKPVSPIVLEPLTDIWVEARGGGANTEVSVDFEILLVDDSLGPIKQI